MKIIRQVAIACSLIIFLISISVTQEKSLLDRGDRIKAKVQIGMSTDEVKKSIGRPKAVESGFPDSDELIISSLPDQHGQLNNSTWFYYYFKQSSKVPRIEEGETKWFINGVQVEEDLYNSYLNKNFVYFRQDHVIDSAIASQYEFFNDKSVSKQPKNQETTRSIKENDHKLIDTVIPILCVIFDRGTNVVSDTKIYFLRINTKRASK